MFTGFSIRFGLTLDMSAKYANAYFYQETFVLWAANSVQTLIMSTRNPWPEKEFQNSVHLFPAYVLLYRRSFSSVDNVIIKLNNIGSAYRHKIRRYSQDSVLMIHSCNIYWVPTMCWALLGTENRVMNRTDMTSALTENMQIVNEQHKIINMK